MEPHLGFLLHQNHKRSSPIDIPTKRQRVRSPPRDVATSPALIFDMSPLECASRAVRPPIGALKGLQGHDSPQPKYGICQPFMYSFPVLASIQPRTNSRRSLVTKSSTCRSDLETPSNATNIEERCDRHRFDIQCDGENMPSDTLHHMHAPRAARRITATRVIGLQPIDKAPAQIQNSRQPSLLLPTFFGSGGAQSPGENVALSMSPADTMDLDDNSYGFKRHLLRRIDDERWVQINDKQATVESVQVSIGG